MQVSEFARRVRPAGEEILSAGAFLGAVEQVRAAVERGGDGFVPATECLELACRGGSVDADVVNSSGVSGVLACVLVNPGLGEFWERYLDIARVIVRDPLVDVSRFSTPVFFGKMMECVRNCEAMRSKVLGFVGDVVEGGNVEGAIAMLDFVEDVLSCYDIVPHEATRILLGMISVVDEVECVRDFVNNRVFELSSQASDLLIVFEQCIRQRWQVDIDVCALTKHFSSCDEKGKVILIRIFQVLFARNDMENLVDFEWRDLMVVYHSQSDELVVQFCDLVSTAISHLPCCCTSVCSREFCSYLVDWGSNRSFILKAAAARTLQHILEVEPSLGFSKDLLDLLAAFLSFGNEQLLGPCLNCLHTIVLQGLSGFRTDDIVEQLSSTGTDVAVHDLALDACASVKMAQIVDQSIQDLVSYASQLHGLLSR